ncbi:hypothetical protein M8J76_012723 [Diaphorina citri]|nr:hypothetical protein M8J76_012723 [Diaphorina citri]
MCIVLRESMCCGPGGKSGRRRYDRYKKITPLVFKQHVPNVSENTLTASGHSEGRISRDDKRFRDLIPNYNQDIIFKDDEGTGADRLMTQRLKEKLNTLAISVMNEWPGVRLRVIEGWDEEGHHASDSLHYEGRAVDITTSDRDSSKYGLLARMAVEAGFDWVYYESRNHIHCSVKTETTHVNGKGAGCFTGDSTVTLDNHKTINITDLNIGDKVLTLNTITGEMEYSEVLLFLHRDPNLVHNFVQITTESGSLIKMTPSHLILRWHRPNAKSILSDIEYTYAERVRVNDSIIVHKNGKAYVERVTRLENVIQTGVYAPLTTSGTIVVNNVFASCYAVIDNQFLAHLSFIPVRLYHSLVNLFSSNHIENSSHVTGIHWYPKLLYSMSDYFIPSAWMNND